MSGPRPLDAILGIGISVALLGGVALWADNRSLSENTQEVTTDNTGLICSLGELISGTPAARRSSESPEEFTERIRLLRAFASDLRDLDDCDPEHPVRVRIPEEDRPALERGRRGGDVDQPPGGGGQPGGGEPPSEPTEQGVLDPVIDPLAPELDCDVTLEGVVICTEPD